MNENLGESSPVKTWDMSPAEQANYSVTVCVRLPLGFLWVSIVRTTKVIHVFVLILWAVWPVVVPVANFEIVTRVNVATRDS